MFVDEKRLGEAQAETWQSRTIRLLRNRGWRQGGYGMPHGPYCLQGAIIQANCEICDTHSIQHQLSARLGTKISQWNDAPERTLDDVIALLSE